VEQDKFESRNVNSEFSRPQLESSIWFLNESSHITAELEDHTVVNSQGIEHPMTHKTVLWSFFSVHLKCSETGAIF
jgi:hypothetical protein